MTCTEGAYWISLVNRGAYTLARFQLACTTVDSVGHRDSDTSGARAQDLGETSYVDWNCPSAYYRWKVGYSNAHLSKGAQLEFIRIISKEIDVPIVFGSHCMHANTNKNIYEVF